MAGNASARTSTDVLDYRIDKAGFLAAFPYLLMAIIVQSAGVLADLARTKGRLTTTQVMQVGGKNKLGGFLVR